MPCVGVSIGVERVFAIMEANHARAHGGTLPRTPPSILVASIPSKRVDMTVARMAVCASLWEAGLSAEMVFAADPKLQKQVTSAAESGTPFMVVLGEDEWERGEVQVKDMAARSAFTVPKGEMVAKLLELGARRVSAGVGHGAVTGGPGVRSPIIATGATDTGGTSSASGSEAAAASSTSAASPSE